jgi:hypothetical protein
MKLCAHRDPLGREEREVYKVHLETTVVTELMA